MSDVIKQMYDEDGNRAFPVTHVNAVKDSNGTTLPDILDRDYPTTSKTPVEGSTEVSLVTRGEKFDYDKVNNATDVTGASDIANLKYVLFNGTNEQFKTALDSYVNERIRSSFGALLHNLDKSGTASGNIDVACVAKTPASGNTPESYDFGSMSAANLASLLGVLIGGQLESLKYFTCTWVEGTATDAVTVAQECYNAIKGVGYKAFMIIHDKSGQRLVYGYIYPSSLPYGQFYIANLGSKTPISVLLNNGTFEVIT